MNADGPTGRTHPHPRYYGTFPRVLGRYVRELKVLTLPEAVKKMTSMNADKIGIKDRGRLKEGLWADVTIFDPDRVIDRATFENPHQYPVGIQYVIVNGVVTIDNEQHTGALAGPRDLRAREEAVRPLASGLGAEVRPLQLADFALDVPRIAVDLEKAPGELNRLLHRPGLEDRKAPDHFLGLRERSVDRRQLAFSQPHTHAFGRRPQAGGADQYPFAGHLVDELAHVLHELLARHLAAVLVDTNHR